jgi:hypothetical protein
MREKIDGRVSVLGGRELVAAAVDGKRVKLSLRAREGTIETADFDHVIAATGYRVDVRRLEFFDEALLAEIVCVKQTPVLSTRFESSARGLYFVGPVAANSFGPLMRFAFGAHFAARRVAGALRSVERAAPHERSAPDALTQ